MRMVECDIKDVVYSKNGYKRTKNFEFIMKFLESGMDCVKVEEYTNKDAKSCASALNISIKKFNLTGARAILSNGEVYLVRADKIEKIKMAKEDV